MSKRQWMRVEGGGLSKDEKASITMACERFIAEVLKPRFLPEIRATEFNYPIDITGKWHGHCYRFIQRFRCAHADSIAEEFDSAFARFDHLGRDRFDIMWHRHTGEWRCLHRSVPLAEALRLMETEELLHPV